jgi:hypothetical protein
MALDPTGNLLFVAGPGDGVVNTLSQLLPVVLTETATSLTLTPGTAALTDSITQSVCVDPSAGSDMVLTADVGGTISAFHYTSAGVLSAPLADPNLKGISLYGGGPDSVVIAPSGKYLYAGVNADWSIYSLSLSSTGVGTWNSNNPTGDTSVGLGNNGPNSVVMNSAGTLLYTGCGNMDGTITSCKVSGLTVTQASQVTASSNGNITGLAIDPTSTYLAAAINDASSVALYSLTTSGKMTLIKKVAVAAVAGSAATPVQVAFHPTLNVFYSTNEGTDSISAFSFTSSTVTSLTPAAGIPIPAASGTYPGPVPLVVR